MSPNFYPSMWEETGKETQADMVRTSKLNTHSGPGQESIFVVVYLFDVITKQT